MSADPLGSTPKREIFITSARKSRTYVFEVDWISGRLPRAVYCVSLGQGGRGFIVRKCSHHAERDDYTANTTTDNETALKLPRHLCLTSLPECLATILRHAVRVDSSPEKNDYLKRFHLQQFICKASFTSVDCTKWYRYTFVMQS